MTADKTRSASRKSIARPVEPGLGLTVEPQPDDVTCGPACLHGDGITLDAVKGDICRPTRS